MLNVRINVNDSGSPAGLDPLDLSGVLDTIATTWREEIRSRTRSGRGADGREMRRRSDGSRTTLDDTGAMLASLRADVDDTGFRLQPVGKRNTIIARTHMRTGRRFMGASDEQIDAARQQVVDALRDRK